MEKPCLKDQNEYPDDAVLERYLGEVKQTWNAFLNLIGESYPSFSGEWRYYNDGKNWLYKITRKKKTVCWVSVYDKKFKTTFYFPDRAEDLITQSTLSQEYVDQFLHGKKYGSIRGITVEITEPADLNATQSLFGIKERLK